MKLPALLVPSPELFVKILSLALSSLISGIMVRLSKWILPDKVVAKMLLLTPATLFESSKYSPRKVNPNLLVGS